MAQAGLPKEKVKALRPLIGAVWRGDIELSFDICHAVVGYPVWVKYLPDSPDPTVFAEETQQIKRTAAYFANGWGGQYLMVFPEQHLVVARLGGTGFADTKDAPKYEMGDLYRLTLALLLQKVATASATVPAGHVARIQP